MAASPAWPRPAGFPSPRGRRGTTLRPERPSPARSGLHTVARSWTASGISGIAELSQLVAVLVPFQPRAQPLGRFADDPELLGHLDRGCTTSGVARIDRARDRQNVAHLRRQLRMDP